MGIITDRISKGGNGVLLIDISELCLNYLYSYWHYLYLLLVRCYVELRRL